MAGKSKKPNLLKSSMQGAKSRFDERLEKAQNVAILGGEVDKEEVPSSTETKTQAANLTKTLGKTKASKSPIATKKTQVRRKGSPQSVPTQLDSFKFPVNEHKQIHELILDYAKRGEIVNKSEIIRLGLAMLKKSTVSERIHALDNLQRVRVGRPPSS